MPALSRAEWDANTKRILDADGVVGLMYEGTSGVRLYTSAHGHAGIVRPELLHAAVALANDALPDEHPGRITATDVAAVDLAIGMIHPFNTGVHFHAALFALRAKLLAMLRPDSNINDGVRAIYGLPKD